MLNIALVTNRKNPRFQWFVDSLFLQWQEKQPPIKLIIVDFYADEPGRKDEFADIAGPFIFDAGVSVKHLTPMGNPWQGQHRITKFDWFAAAYARNTAICLADDGAIAFVDDLSVLMPGWLDQALEAAAGGWIACGAYAKVTNLIVENGIVKSFDGCPNGLSDGSIWNQVAKNSTHQSGLDTRAKHTPEDDAPYSCDGNWMFGYAVAPVEAMLAINGYDCDSCSLGFEDVLAGIMLQQHGYKFRYCKKLMALESEEGHGEGQVFDRHIKGPPGKSDQSWALLNMVQSGQRNVAPNYFGPEGIRGVRRKVLAGEPFPIIKNPQHCWFDGESLATMEPQHKK